MKKIFLFLAVLSCSVLLFGQAPEPKKWSDADLKLCYELFDALKMEKQFQDMSEQMLSLQIQSNPMLVPFKPEMEAFFRKYVQFKDLKKGLAEIYLELFTPAQLRDGIRFYRSPAGEAFADKTTLLAAKAAGLSQAIVMRHMPELQQAIQAKMQKLQMQQKKPLPTSGK